MSKELDARVHRDVFGLDIEIQENHDWHVCSASGWAMVCVRCGRTQLPLDTSCCIPPIPPYSTTIAAAMSALDTWDGDVNLRRQNDVWIITLLRPSQEWRSYRSALPSAICQALLTAVGASDE